MSERRLSEIAKVLRQPEGIVGSEFTRINKAARKAGIRFDLWQQGFLWLLFAKNTEGKYACGADGAVLSSCRQIGKTFTVVTASPDRTDLYEVRASWDGTTQHKYVVYHHSILVVVEWDEKL